MSILFWGSLILGFVLYIYAVLKELSLWDQTVQVESLKNGIAIWFFGSLLLGITVVVWNIAPSSPDEKFATVFDILGHDLYPLVGYIWLTATTIVAIKSWNFWKKGRTKNNS